jgi:ribosomal protein RSM22 (predicted rRNA methylase)
MDERFLPGVRERGHTWVSAHRVCASRVQADGKERVSRDRASRKIITKRASDEQAASIRRSCTGQAWGKQSTSIEGQFGGVACTGGA